MKPAICYFDDEKILLDLFTELFKDTYQIRTAETVAEARRLLSWCPDIIMSDWKMPEISGAAFLSEAAERCPGSFRIMLTGYASAGDMLTEISSGVVQLFIPKPWTELEMREALERALLTRARPGRKTLG